jgi:hypothetical protein
MGRPPPLGYGEGSIYFEKATGRYRGEVKKSNGQRPRLGSRDTRGVLVPCQRVGYYLRLVWQVTDDALRPIPPLTEIDQQLRAEGYNPSIADVVAMQQHLTSQRNGAALTAGALVIGPQLLARQAQGKSIW